MRYLIILALLLYGCDQPPQPQPQPPQGGVVIINNMAVPTTTLDQQGMQIQQEEGCKGCHKEKAKP